jgi:uncharacterized protein (DUF2147 family)
MPIKQACRLLILFILLGIRATTALAQDFLEHNLWYNEEKTAKIQIYKATDGKFYGKIVWLKIPDQDGKPKVDVHNPDKSKQNDPIMGLLLLKGFNKDGEKEYSDGTIYDPKNGKTYKCKITNKGDQLDVRGFIGFSWIGRTTVWTKVD